VTRVLDAPPSGWSTLLAEDRNATPAHRPELWTELARVLEGMSPRFVAVEEHGALLGGGPVFIQRRAGFHWIHALPFLLTGAPLARAGAHGAVDAAFGAALAELQCGLPGVGGAWSLYRPEGPAADPATLDQLSGETRFVETSLIELEDGIDAARSRIERDTRYELRRARARGLVIAQEPERVDEVYALHLAQARHWPGYRPLPLELSRRLLAARGDAEGSREPMARLFVARDARGVVCSMFFLDHSREMFAWWGVTRGGGRGQHAMPYLLWSAAQWAAAAGRSRVNLGGSAGRNTLAAFKHGLGSRAVSYPVRWMDARHGPWMVRWLAALQHWVRRDRFRGEAA
jgi:hypothetical protein